MGKALAGSELRELKAIAFLPFSLSEGLDWTFHVEGRLPLLEPTSVKPSLSVVLGLSLSQALR